MSRFLTTCPGMLSQMRRGDPEGMGTLVERYTAPALAFLRRLGLQPVDAEGVWQEVVIGMSAGGIAGYQREKGRFRVYLMAALQNRFRDAKRRQQRQGRDQRLTDSLEATVTSGENSERALLDTLEAKCSAEEERKRAEVQETIGWLLKDYAAQGIDDAARAWLEFEKRLYLDWFWNGDRTRTDSGRWRCHLTDGEIAQAEGWELHQYRYRLKKAGLANTEALLEKVERFLSEQAKCGGEW